MNQPEPRRPSDPYQSIESYWGEPLSGELVQRITTAPRGHLVDCRRYKFENERAAGVVALPELPPGHLRPIVSVHAIDGAMIVNHVDLSMRALVAANTAITALLYAHQVVVDDVSWLLIEDDPQTQASAGQWLMQVKPLFDGTYSEVL